MQATPLRVQSGYIQCSDCVNMFQNSFRQRACSQGGARRELKHGSLGQNATAITNVLCGRLPFIPCYLISQSGIAPQCLQLQTLPFFDLFPLLLSSIIHFFPSLLLISNSSKAGYYLSLFSYKQNQIHITLSSLLHQLLPHLLTLF